MNENFTLRGGAIIGSVYAGYPFVKLFVDKDVLKIKDGILGSFVFLPQDIISIEPYSKNSSLGKGIRINHRLKKYNPKVIFCTSKDPGFIINEIKNVGFLDKINSKISAADTEIIKRQQQESNPIKKPVSIFLIVLFKIIILSNILIFFSLDKQIAIPIHIGVKIAIVLIFASSILTLISDSFRKLILKEGREFNEIKKSVYIIILISGIMLLS